jgi:malonyl-ACP decarboxylase
VTSKLPVVITGLGAFGGFGAGVEALAHAALQGAGTFGLRDVDGLQQGIPCSASDTPSVQDVFSAVGTRSEEMSRRFGRLMASAPKDIRAAVQVGLEAWTVAGLWDAPPARTSVVVSGSNLSQARTAALAIKRHARKSRVRPRWALQFLDTCAVGFLSEVLGITGEGWTAGAASASGNLALLQAARHIADGYADRVLVIGALTELSALELEALDTLGALVDGRQGGDPAQACRPFDRHRIGFVPAEIAAAIVLERADVAAARGARPLARWLGGAMRLDGTHLPRPSEAGEACVMRAALEDAGLSAAAVDLVSAHATASQLGDEAEAAAIAAVFGAHRPWVQAPKGLLGHGLCSAGVIEAVLSVQQLDHSVIYKNHNLTTPIRDDLRFVGAISSPNTSLRTIMSNSFGFGGINTAVLLGRAGE